ncbi:hypothetical protein [Thermocrinis sp.]
MLKKILLEDIHYKALALVIGFFLWFAVNFGTRAVVSIEKELEIRNAEERYTYRLSKKRVRIRVSFIERLIPSETVEKVKPFVDVRGLSPGRHVLKVQMDNPYKVLVSLEKMEPEKVEVYIIEAPQGGK